MEDKLWVPQSMVEKTIWYVQKKQSRTVNEIRVFLKVTFATNIQSLKITYFPRVNRTKVGLNCNTTKPDI